MAERAVPAPGGQVSARPVAIAGLMLLPALVFLRGWSTYKGRFRHEWGGNPPLAPAVESLRTPVIPMLVLAAVLMLAYLEWHDRRVTRVIAGLSRRRWAFAAVLTLVFIAAASETILPGWPVVADALGETALGWTIHQALRRGQLTIWSNYAYFGFPATQFRSPLSQIAAALLMFPVPDPNAATKLMLLACQVLSGWTLYALVRRWRGSTAAGVVAGLAWVLTPYHFKTVVYIGRYHVAPLFALLPLPLLFAERIAAQERPARSAAWLALSLAGLVWTHVTYGGLAVALAALYGVLCVALVAGSPAERRRAALWLAIGLALGLVMALPRVVPVFLERDHVLRLGDFFAPQFSLAPVGVDQVLLGVRYNVESPNPDDIYAGYFGLSVTGLALVGIVAALRRRARTAWPMLAFLLAGLYLGFGPRYLPFDAIFQHIPFGTLIYLGKSPAFYLVYPLMALCAFAGVACEAAAAAWARREPGPPGEAVRRRARREPGLPGEAARGRAAAVIVLLVVADLLPPSFNLYSYGYEYPLPERQAAYEWLRGQPRDFSRVVDVEVEHAALEMILTGHPGLFATHEEATHRAGGLAYTARRELRQEVQAHGDLTPTGEWLAYLLNVGYVLAPGLEPGPDVVSFGPDAEGVRVVGARSPLVATARPVAATPDADPITLAGQVSIDPATNTADWLPVLGEVALTANPTATTSLQADMLRHAVEPQHVELEFELSEPAFVQISWAYYPYLAVTLDGQRIEAQETAFGLIGFWAGAGRHVVETRPFLSPVRHLTGGVALAALAACAGLWLFAERRQGA